MTFNSLAFLAFFILVFIVYWLLPHKAQNVFLLAASYIFYGWWDVRFLFLILVSTCLDFVCGLMIHQGALTKKQRAIVSAWIVSGAFFFVVVPWNRLWAGTGGAGLFWKQLVSWNGSWVLFAAVTLLALAFHLIYPRLVRLDEKKRKRLFLSASVIGNLAILGYFKYYNFFIDNLAPIVKGLGLNPARLHLDIVLPVGISFFIFMTLTYSIDIYRGSLAPTQKLHEYALYLAFFPKLLAGPIQRAATFLPQIAQKRALGAARIANGWQLILYGLFKKIVIADGVAKTVSAVFAGTYRLSWADAVLGAVLFTIQIYCDFSGYSDIAIGTAGLLGFDLMKNFNYPYFSRNPSEFWGRWHISLSSWFRDYVFFPLGGPYGRTLKWTRNILVTFFVTGLWHGAAWNFIVWGLYHGLLLCLHRLKESLRKTKRRVRKSWRSALAVAFFFGLTCLGWVVFRAHSMAQIRDIFQTLFTGTGGLKRTVELPSYGALLGLPVFIAVEFILNRARGKRLDQAAPMPIWTAAYSAMIFLIILGLANVPAEFIYLTF